MLTNKPCERRVNANRGGFLGPRPLCRACLLLTLLATCGVFQPVSFAQDPAGELMYTRLAVFKIPFQTDPNDRRLRQIQLYVSVDQGRSWQNTANVRPEDGSFTFSAPRDGHYWFTVRTTDANGNQFPLSMETARPGLKVYVDTHPPAVQIRPQSPRDSQSGIEWDIQDDSLDLSTLVLEYHPEGLANWIPLSVQATANGSHYWNPGTNGATEVRLRVRDRAGNEGEAKTTVLSAQDGRTSAEPAKNTQAAAGSTLVRHVNSKRISLNYDLKEVGKSGVSVVELWYTQDGHNWQKYNEIASPTAPYVYVVDVVGEGLYGFTLLVKSGVGFFDRSPQTNDPPQVWVEVDLTKPVVRLQNVDVGRGPEHGNMTVTWTATDKNLKQQPITLSYAEQNTGPWLPIAANIENTGKYVWRIPPEVPSRIFVKVEAVDKAENIGFAEYPKPVPVDLSLPKSVILSVEPVKK